MLFLLLLHQVIQELEVMFFQVKLQIQILNTKSMLAAVEVELQLLAVLTARFYFQ